MKFLLPGLFLLGTIHLHALDSPDRGNTIEEPSPDHDGYWYVSGGLALIAPKVSLGYRFQRGKFGGDISITEATIPPEFFSQGLQFNQLYYPHPNLKGKWYIGLSEGIHYVLGKHPIGVFWETSVGVVGGYQFKPKKRRHFIEGKIGVPIRISAQGAKFPVPIPSISYGVSF